MGKKNENEQNDFFDALDAEADAGKAILEGQVLQDIEDTGVFESALDTAAGEGMTLIDNEAAIDRPGPDLIDMGFNVVEDLGGGAIQGMGALLQESGVAPFLQAVDEYTGAPVRAGFAELIQGNNPFGAAFDAFGDASQAPTGAQVAQIALSQLDDETKNKTLAEVMPQIFSSTGSGKKLKKGGVADVSLQDALGVVFDMGLDLTTLIPPAKIAKTGLAAASGALKSTTALPAAGLATAGRGINKVTGNAFVKTKDEILESAKKSKSLAVGHILTDEGLPINKSAKAMTDLRTRDVWFPGSPERGTMSKTIKEIGDIKRKYSGHKIPMTMEAIDGVKQNVMAHALAHIDGGLENAFVKEVMKNLDEATSMKNLVQTPDGRLGHVIDAKEGIATVELFEHVTPEMNLLESAVVDLPTSLIKITDDVVPAEALTLGQLDSVIGNVDRFVNFAKDKAGIPGYEAGRTALQPILMHSRMSMNDMFKAVPEMGQELVEKRNKLSKLADVRGIKQKGRTSIQETIKRAGLGAFSSALAASLDPVMGGLIGTAVVMRNLDPATWLKIAESVRIPRKYISNINGALDTGKVTPIFEAMVDTYNKAPGEVAEKLSLALRHVGIAYDAESAGLNYDPDESNASAHKIYNPESIAKRKIQIRNDGSMSSVDKARELTKINKNGYYEVDLGSDYSQLTPKEAEKKTNVIDVRTFEDILKGSL